MESNPNLNQTPTQNSPVSPISDPTAQWFESLPETGPSKAPKTSHTKIFLLVGSVIVVLFIGAVLLLLNGRQPCLTTDNLRELSGNSEIESTSSSSGNSLAYYVYFEPNSSSYDVSAEQSGPVIIKRVAEFYQKNPKTSLELTFSSTYLTTEDKSSAIERSATIKSSLIEAGVPENKIVVNDPAQVDQEDDSQNTVNTTLFISSAGTCK